MKQRKLHLPFRVRSRLERGSAMLSAGLVAVAVALVAASCSVSESAPISVANDLRDGGGGFSAITPGADGDRRVEYCPSDQCPASHTTCPLSTFRCDVNLLTDRNNCGACGVACPALDYDRGTLYECVDGKCVMQCAVNFGDCDGVVDNGCESVLYTNDNCKVCGNKCAADKPCSRRSDGIGCGCRDGEIYCGELGCIDPSQDDGNCGACGTVCAPGTIENNSYHGCVGGECGRLKCLSEWGNCDVDPRNGCEERLITKENCGHCGAACPGDQECRYIWYFPVEPVLQCACPAGQTFCELGMVGDTPMGQCRDLRSDEQACGACGIACGLDERCAFGVCRLDCFAGTEDCNGSKMDGCEVNTGSDPNNCGGCGITCDGVAGQACVGGRCVVEPCDEVDAGGGPTR